MWEREKKKGEKKRHREGNRDKAEKGERKRADMSDSFI